MLATGTDALGGRTWCRIFVTPTRTPSTCGAMRDALMTSATSSTTEKMYEASSPGTRWWAVACCSTSHASMEWAADGYGIFNDELDACAGAQNVTIGRADFVMHASARWNAASRKENGAAMRAVPGVKFENCYWCQEKEVTAICTEYGAWRCGRRQGSKPTPGIGSSFRRWDSPWERCLSERPGCGLRHRRHEFFFCGPPLVVTGKTR